MRGSLHWGCALAACLSLATCATPAPAPHARPAAPARPIVSPAARPILRPTAQVVARRPVPPGTLGQDLAAFGFVRSDLDPGFARAGGPRTAATEWVVRAPDGAIRDEIVMP